jgi:hypothetical protein
MQSVTRPDVLTEMRGHARRDNPCLVTLSQEQSLVVIMFGT